MAAERPPPQPEITVFGPVSGSAGAHVGIVGNYFSAISAVQFNGVDATFTLTPSYVSATVPVGAGTGPISIVTEGGGTITSSQVFTVLP